MLFGLIEALTSTGCILGWAFDSAAPATPLSIAIIEADGAMVAAGLANRYRDDLVDAGCGIGWCAFSLRVEATSPLRRSTLILTDTSSGREIHRIQAAPYLDAPDDDIRDVETLLASDPTVAKSVQELRGCSVFFSNYVVRQGVEDFVRAAYVYVLGRPADVGGLASYGGLIRTGDLTPFQLLEILADCDEYRLRPRQLGAPNLANFPLGAI